MERTEQQRQAIEANESYVCVDAGAGSGKTSVLVERIVRLLASRICTLDQIVAITFTDKAAAEMKHRLRAVCRSLAPVDEPAVFSFWRAIERQVETARISTIHSFCSSILRENALRVGTDPDFRLLTPAESHLALQTLVRDTLVSLFEQGDASSLALVGELGLARLETLVHGMLKHEKALLQLATSPAFESAANLFRHWTVVVNGIKQGIWQTFRNDLYALPGELRSYESACTKATDSSEALRKQLVHFLETMLAADFPDSFVAEWSLVTSIKLSSASKKAWSSESVYERIKEIRDNLKDTLSVFISEEYDVRNDFQAAEFTFAAIRVFQAVADVQRESRTAQAVTDFDGLIAGAHALLRDNLDVRERTAQGIQYLLIDEFQDTDPLQLEIATLLRETQSAPALFIVGDAKQSIYRFRGADVGVFQQAKRDADIVIPLDVNFRSVPEVLSFVNEFFIRTNMLSAVEEQYAGLRAFKPAAAHTTIEFIAPFLPEKSVLEAARKAEADGIATRMLELAAEGVEYGKMAILFRALSNVGLYEQALREAGIPYTVASGRGYYERQEVLDIRNLLTVIADPWNESALLAFLRGPIARLNDDEIVSLGSGALAEAFHGNSPAYPKLDAARTLVRELRVRRQDSLATFIRHVIERTGYEAIALSQFLGVQRASNVRKLIDLANAFTASGETSLSAFIRYLDEVAAEELREGEASLETESGDAVTISSIHASKGLEYDTVFLADLARQTRGRAGGLFSYHPKLGFAVPGVTATGESQPAAISKFIERRNSDEDNDELARLLYVAMTRAKNRLILCGAFVETKSERKASNTWLAQFDALYGVSGRQHGEHLSSQDGVDIRVWSDFDATTRVVESLGREALRLTEMDERRIAPCEHNASFRTSVSVSELLNRHFPFQGEASTSEDHVDGQELALLRGTLTHRMLELWRTGVPVNLVIQWLIENECPVITQRTRMSQALQKAADTFGSFVRTGPPWQGEIVQRELPFVVNFGEVVVNGVIDAVTESGEILDYKTGAPSPDLEDRYRWQLRFYAGALRRIHNVLPPRAWLYYCDSGTAKEVPLDLESVSRVFAEAQSLAVVAPTSASVIDEDDILALYAGR